MLPKGTGWSEEGRASCQQAVGRGGGAGRLAGPGGRGRYIQGEHLPGEGEGLGQLGNSRGWQKPGSRGEQEAASQQEREGEAEAEEAQRRGVLLIEEAGVSDTSTSLMYSISLLTGQCDLYCYTSGAS